MKVGTMFFGDVEELDGESIQTKFFVLGIPLFPLESFYATSTEISGLRGLPIELHPTSVVAGYLRLGTGLGAVLLGLFAWLEWRSYDPQWGLAGLAALCAVVWVPSMFWLGRLSEAERERRRLLRAVSGIGAPPELLSTGVREGLGEGVRARWSAVTGLTDWRARLKSGEAAPQELPFLWALAQYDLDTELSEFAAAFLKSTAQPRAESDLFRSTAG